MEQINRLLVFLNLRSADRVLDLGCGNGKMSEFISEKTGAHVTGIDNIPEAIRQAQARIRGKNKSVSFRVMDIESLHFPTSSFDTIISVDTLYFTDMITTLGKLWGILKPDGQIGIYYSHGVSSDEPAERFDLNSLHPDRTPLANAIRVNGLKYKVWDFTAEDYSHALLKKKVAEELRTDFEAEGNSFLFDNRYEEANGVIRAIDEDAHRRYLYHVTCFHPTQNST